MKHINQLYYQAGGHSVFSQAIKAEESLYFGFSEEELLILQDSFFNPGIHMVATKDMLSNRKILSTFLRFIDRSQIAYLSYFSLPEDITNIYQDLCSADLEEYLLNSFYYDYLIIEITTDLLEQSWFAIFEKLLIDFNYITTLSVVLLI